MTEGTRIFFVPGGFKDPQAPTLAELSAGIELTEVTAIRFSGPREGRRAMHSTYHLKVRRRTIRRSHRRR